MTSTRLVAIGLLLLGLDLQAAPSYVIDKLLVGVHEEKNLDSAIIKVLPTGAELTVLETDGELALIEDQEKVRGWVDSAYLTDEPPAALRLAALQRDKRALEAEVEKLKRSAPAASSGGADNAPSGAEVDALTNENTELKAKLSEQRLRAGKLQSEAAALKAELRNHQAPPDQRLVELERDRDELAGQLEQAKGKIDDLSARASLTETSALVPLVVKEYFLSISISVLLLVALGFGAGLYVVDFLSRRRHGGFRV